MEQLRNAEEIAAERDRLASTFDSWDPPHAFGVALVPTAVGALLPEHFGIVNFVPKTLHCIALAEVTGYRGGDAVHELSRADLERAISLLQPAEAFVEYQHPNLWLWRDSYLPALDRDPGARLVATFFATPELHGGPGAEFDAFRSAVAVARDGGTAD